MSNDELNDTGYGPVGRFHDAMRSQQQTMELDGDEIGVTFASTNPDDRQELGVFEDGDGTLFLQDMSDAEVMKDFIYYGISQVPGNEESAGTKAKEPEQSKALARRKQITNQDPAEVWFSGHGSDKGEVYLPLEATPMDWAALAKRNFMLDSVIMAKSSAVTRQIYRVLPRRNKQRMDEAAQKKFEAGRDILEDLFDFPDDVDRLSMEDILYRWKYDYETVGYAALEIGRALDPIKGSEGAPITNIYHIPAFTFRKRKELTDTKTGYRSEMGYVQYVSSYKKYFKKFGDTRIISALNGRVLKGFDPERGMNVVPSNVDKELYPEDIVPIEHQANELIYKCKYDPTDLHYGTPDHKSAIYAIMGSRSAERSNYVFFRNNAVPRFVVLVTGGVLDSESEKNIGTFFRESAKGELSAHKTLIIKAYPKNRGPLGGTQQVRVELQPITVGKTEDMNHLKYLEYNGNAIRSTHRVSEIFLGNAHGVTRSAALAIIQIGNQLVFLPDQREVNHLINSTVVKDMGYADVCKFSLSPLEETDPIEKARIQALRIQSSSTTPNRVAQANGEDPVGPMGDLPLPLALLIVSGVLGQKLANPQLSADFLEAVMTGDTKQIAGTLRDIMGSAAMEQSRLQNRPDKAGGEASDDKARAKRKDEDGEGDEDDENLDEDALKDAMDEYSDMAVNAGYRDSLDRLPPAPPAIADPIRRGDHLKPR